MGELQGVHRRERGRLREYPEPLREYPVACLHELFEAQAARRPGAPAVTFDGQTISYAELNARANRLAHRLRDLGIGAESLVALFLDRSVELIVAVLGVLKAGGAYVPLDPEYPAPRLRFMLADTGAPVVVTQRRLCERLPDGGARVVCVEDVLPPAGAAENPASLTTPENLAYVIYTSGSTGRPKGVQVEHRQVARLLSATEHWYGFDESDVWVLAHSYAFDVSVWEMWGALAAGGRIVIAPFWVTRSPRDFAALLAEHGVSVLCNTPSLFNSIEDELLARGDELALRYVVFGGEWLMPGALRAWFDRFGEHGPRLVNQYGTTETTVHSTYRVIRPADCERDVSPVGVPVPDVDLYLLDPRGEPVPDGVAGEIYIGGAGVARGYLNRPALTAQRFVTNPFGPGRLYRSGDLARRLPDGEIAFIGRIDDQVKIRGFRVEPGEIASVAEEHEGVASCAVVAVRGRGDTRLAAYVVPEDVPEAVNGAAAVGVSAGKRAPARLRAELRAHLEANLPGYMVPASITFLDALPLTINGKLDRRALPAPQWETASEATYVAPRTATEHGLAEVWREVLGVERVGTSHNFFDLGGHSLLAAAVVARLRDRLGVEVGVRALFERPTVEEFAEHVDSLRDQRSAGARGGLDAVAPGPAGEIRVIREMRAATTGPAAGETAAAPLSFQQRSLLFFDALQRAGTVYNQAWTVSVSGPVDATALGRALRELAERQPALRTVFVGDGADLRQVVVDPDEVRLQIVDGSRLGLGVDGREAQLERWLINYGRRPFDLARDVPLRAALLELGPEQFVLAFQAHHIAIDGWAAAILFEELTELYAAAVQGRQADLPALPWTYGDYARWQRERLQGPWLARELDFWRRQLAGAPALLPLATDRHRPPERTFDGATHRFALDGDAAGAVRHAARTRGATPYMVLMAAFATLLYRLGGEADIVLGTPMANRDHPALERLIGFCANTVAVRLQLGGNPTFEELLGRVRDSVLASYEHQEVPLELVVDAVRPERRPGVNPLFQVNFRVLVGPSPTLALAGTRTRWAPVDLAHARFDLALELHLLDDAIEAELDYNTALFEPDTIKRLAGEFEHLLRQALCRLDTRLLSIPLAAQEWSRRANGDRPAPRAIVSRRRR